LDTIFNKHVEYKATPKDNLLNTEFIKILPNILTAVILSTPLIKSFINLQASGDVQDILSSLILLPYIYSNLKFVEKYFINFQSKEEA
jgi:hypothetical protein